MIIHPHEQENNHMSDIPQNPTSVNVSQELTDEQIDALNDTFPHDDTPGGFTYEELSDEQKAKFAKKAKDSAKGKKPKGPTKKEVVESIAYAMEGKMMPEPWRDFPVRPIVMRDPKGEHLCFLADDKQVMTEIGDEGLKTYIAQYIKDNVHLNKLADENLVKETLSFWKRTAKPVKQSEVSIVRQASKPGYTYRRLPWDLSDGPTPLFDEMMARTSNALALQDFIGSIFIDDADRQTFAWIYGEGADGKGALIRLLENAFGEAFAMENAANMTSNFWTAGFLGKRVVSFSDCDDPKLLKNGLFKSLTGGDSIRVEVKKKMPYTAKLFTMIFCTSNELPAIGKRESELRRIIFCFMKPPKEQTPDFERRLWEEEARHIFWKCIKGYMARYPKRTRIIAERTEILDIADASQEFNQAIFDKHFDKIGINKEKKDHEQAFTEPGRIQTLLKDTEKLNYSERMSFMKYLREHCGFKSTMVSDRDKKIHERRWLGFSEKRNAAKPVEQRAGYL